MDNKDNLEKDTTEETNAEAINDEETIENNANDNLEDDVNNDILNEEVIDSNENIEKTIENNMEVKSSKLWIVLILLLLLGLGLGATFYYINVKNDNKNSGNNEKIKEEVNKKENKEENNKEEELEDIEEETEIKEENIIKEEINGELNKSLSYEVNSNEISNFDLAFLQLYNTKSNKAYSPLSIKYLLSMLKDASSNNTKNQINNVLKNYNLKKYNNSKNLSLSNALFIKDDYKNYIKDSYINDIKAKYNGSVIYDPFDNATNLNKWVSDNTNKLINSIIDDETITDLDYALINALAIDMEWINVMSDGYWRVDYDHEKYSAIAYSESFKLDGRLTYYDRNKFNNDKKVIVSNIGASINKYDIVNILGEDNIRDTITKEYKEWLEELKFTKEEDEIEEFVNNYIKELDSNYKKISSSTDFYLYNDDDVKVFAKDLKEYDGVNLQYIGIMPTNVSLDSYIEDIDVNNVNNIINNLKDIKLENFEENYITRIEGSIPIFDINYDMDLVESLSKLGIIDIFDIGKSDLTNMTTTESSVSYAKNRTNISFSNEGIKAASLSIGGGAGAAGGGFEYLYEVPVIEIDLTFDKPYMFIIRDKDTNEVWFAGTVYNPTEYTGNYSYEWD